ncbi:MAG: radical SAM family heme chaperone HemW [Firmicutes bacterium]|nr:radical SAM family heme chaperone HemW [Bacillota bacterium]
MQLALYLHLPFCVRKCTYCAFNSRPLPPGGAGEDLLRRYLGALEAELRLAAAFTGKQTLRSIYFGGGTPTLLAAPDLIHILEQTTRYFNWSPAIEITVEANPGTVSRAKLRPLREAGVNRISLGAQSFNPGELRLLGRVHGVREIYASCRDARAAGFENLSLDLIYGIPGQTPAAWRRSLQQALALGPEHLSVYGLILEEGTPLAGEVAAGRLEPCSEEDQLAMWEATAELLAAAGYERYEIASFARPGRRCRHNLAYWRNRPYLGIGAGAHGYFGGVRYANHADVERYLQALAEERLPRAWEENQTPEQERIDTIIMGLRLTRGLSLRAFKARFGVAFTELYRCELDRLARAGLIEADETSVFLTPRGRLLANYVLAHFV